MREPWQTSTSFLPEPGDEEVRTFESDDHVLDRDALARFRGLVGETDLVAPAVALPDFHQEANMEAPCSIAVATREFIRPTVSNASVNCGMALIALDTARPPDHAVERFYSRARAAMPNRTGPRSKLSAREVIRASIEGSAFAVDRFDVDASELDRVEEHGRLDVDRYGGANRLRRELPALIVQLSRLRFGTVGPSNHFIELQEVEEILDPDGARALGIRPGQITLQFHAGGGVLTGLVGRLFGRRTDYPKRHRAIMSIAKPAYHLLSARSIAEIRRRRALYFAGTCAPIARDSDEGERYMLANAAAMNYGFAFRLAVYARLRSFVEECFGASSRLIVDSPHDTLYEEEVNGEHALVHRYKTSRAYPASRLGEHPVYGRTGQPVLLPGTNRTSSFLAVADENASASLYSASHGTGSIIADFESRGLSRADPMGRTTTRFGYSDSEPVRVPHLDDRGVNAALHILQTRRIIRPIARLRPFAVLT